jgi:hypothetical protein
VHPAPANPSASASRPASERHDRVAVKSIQRIDLSAERAELGQGAILRLGARQFDSNLKY